MRRALALAPIAALTLAGVALSTPAQAETWTKVFTMDNGASINIDTDYSYRDSQSGRVVVMQALSKGAIGPSAPGKPDGVGSVVAIDCSNKNVIPLGSYKPSAPLDIKSTWRSDTPKKMTGADNEAIVAAVCPTASKLPSK